MKSLKNRFNGNKQEILEYVRLFGQNDAMIKFKEPGTVCLDGIAFRKWLKEVTGEENYGLSPQVPSVVIPRGENPIEYIFSGLADCVVNLKTELAQRNEEVGSLKEEIRLLKESQTEQITRGLLTVLQACNQ